MFTKNNIDYRNPGYNENIDNLEDFTLKNIETINLKNEDHIKTKSLILAPFNTSIGNSNFLTDTLDIKNNCIKFNGKVRELNKIYEINNNGEIDNGMIISPNGNSLVNDSLDEKLINNIVDINQNKSKLNSKSGSGLQTPNPDSLIRFNFTNKNESKIIDDNQSLDEEIIEAIFNFGYSKNFVRKSLEMNELNYATASYYLLIKKD